MWISDLSCSDQAFMGNLDNWTFYCCNVCFKGVEFLSQTFIY